MKNKLLSIAVAIPLFIMLSLSTPSTAVSDESFSPNLATGSWTISFSQIDPAPCGTLTVYANYNGGGSPDAGDITVNKILNSNVTASPTSITAPITSTSFTVGTITLGNNTTSNQSFRLTTSVTGGHTITNPVTNTHIESCL